MKTIKRIPMTEAKAKLHTLVAQGEDHPCMLTSRGKPVALLESCRRIALFRETLSASLRVRFLSVVVIRSPILFGTAIEEVLC